MATGRGAAVFRFRRLYIPATQYGVKHAIDVFESCAMRGAAISTLKDLSADIPSALSARWTALNGGPKCSTLLRRALSAMDEIQLSDTGGPSYATFMEHLDRRPREESSTSPATVSFSIHGWYSAIIPLLVSSVPSDSLLSKIAGVPARRRWLLGVRQGPNGRR